MRYFHETLIRLPKVKDIDERAFQSIKESLFLATKGQTPLDGTDSFMVRDQEDSHLKAYLVDLFKSYYPGMPTDSLRVVHCYRAGLQRFAVLKNTMTANIVLHAPSHGCKIQGMNYRHMEDSRLEQPDQIVLRKGVAFLMEADAWHTILSQTTSLLNPADAIYLLQADLCYTDPKHDAVTPSRKHRMINEVLRMAKNAALPAPNTSTERSYHEHELWNKENQKDYWPEVSSIQPATTAAAAAALHQRIFGSDSRGHVPELVD